VDVVGSRAVTETSLPEPALPPLPNLDAALATVELDFQYGKLAASRAGADAALARARAAGDALCEARAHQILGEIDYDELRYPEALAHIEAAMALRERLLGLDHVATRYSIACRAFVLLSEDRYDESDRELLRARPEGVPDERIAADVLEARLWVTIGAALHGRDHNVEARRVFETFLALVDRVPGVDRITVANACIQFSTLLETEEDSKGAAEVTRRAIAIRTELMGVPSLRVGLALLGVGTAHLRSNETAEACRVLMESAEMLRASGHEAHPRASVVYLGIAVAEMISGRGAVSETWMTKAVDLETRTFGGAHPNTATMMLTAAQMYAARGYHGRAAEIAQRAASSLVPRARTRGDSLRVAIGQAFLSLRHLKRHDAIVRWLEPILAQLEKMTPLPDEVIAPALNMIGEAYAAAGKLGKAEAVVRRALRMAEAVHGEDAEQVGVVLTNLAVLLRKQKRTSEAADAEARARRIAEEGALRSASPMSRWRRGMA
jgi:tetratricopeptide (TPR) repeat protein